MECLWLQLAFITEREGGGPKAVEAANAAHDLLIALGTHASHGMLPVSEHRGDSEVYSQGVAVQGKPSSGECMIAACVLGTFLYKYVHEQVSSKNSQAALSALRD